MKNLENRYDFVYIFDVKDGNPNGDPDAANLPRIDSETGQGIVTDVCLKRKVRNYVGLMKNAQSPFDIYVKDKTVLGDAHVKAFNDLNIKLGEESKEEIPVDLIADLDDISLPEGIFIEDREDKKFMVVASGIDKKDLKEQIENPDNNIPAKVQKFLGSILKKATSRKPTDKETETGRNHMCKTYYDVRAFGAVMSLASAPNCGQVRGPIQMTFARSIDQIVSLEHSITRVAVTTQQQAATGAKTMFGRKHTVPYGLYVAYGFVSAFLAKQTGFSDEDLELFWNSLINMFEIDRSAAKGLMSAQKLYVFKHKDELGNAAANKLFDLVTPFIKKKKEDLPARDISDYEIPTEENIKSKLPDGIDLIVKI
jgi:CRISPR-associated protein Csd2